MSPLHWASMGEHLRVVQFLLTKGANKEATDDYGRSPLHLASEHARGVALLDIRRAVADAVKKEPGNYMHGGGSGGGGSGGGGRPRKKINIAVDSNDCIVECTGTGLGVRIPVVQCLVQKGAKLEVSAVSRCNGRQRVLSSTHTLTLSFFFISLFTRWLTTTVRRRCTALQWRAGGPSSTFCWTPAPIETLLIM
jgi:hypothetical protein